MRQPELALIVTAPANLRRMAHLTLPTTWARSQFKLSVFVSHANKQVGISLMCRGDAGGENFQRLRASKDVLEATLGRLSWETGGAEKGWLVQYIPQNDPTQVGDWPRQHQILAAKVVEFFRVLDPYVQAVVGAGES